jgi:hypothetical protein
MFLHRVEDLLVLRSKLSGLSVLSRNSEEVVLGICLKLPTARQQGLDAAAAGAQAVCCFACRPISARAVVEPRPAAKLHCILMKEWGNCMLMKPSCNTC